MSKNRTLASLISNVTSKVKQTYIDSDVIVTSASLGVTAAAGTAIYSSADTLPASADNGDQAFVTSTNRLYIYTNGGWYNIALINSTPYWSSEASSSYDLSTTGASTVITILAVDSEGIPIVYTATADSDFNQIATLSRDSDNGRTFTITPTDSENGTAIAGSGTITFKASDGVNLVSTLSTFSLSFGPDWSSYTLLKEVSGSAAYDLFATNSHISPDGNWAFAMLGGSSATSHLKIYSRSGSTWTETQQIGTSQWVDEALYGQNCSISCSEDGEWLVVGNIGEDDYGTNAGVAYLYQRTSGTYAYVKDLSYNAANSFFGRDVAMSRDGTFVAVSGERFDGAYSDQGAVRVYTTTDNWSTHSGITLLASNAQATDYFGYVVELSGDMNYMIVEARVEDGPTDANTNTGAVYVYTRSGSTWTEQAIVRHPSTPNDAYFGQGSAINYDGTVMVCSASDGHLIFTRSGSTWTFQQKVGPTSNVAIGIGGNAINDAGNLLVTSDYNNELTQIYKEESGTWSLVNTLTSTLPAGKRWGYSVFADKDFNYILVGSSNDGGVVNSDGLLSFFEAG